MIAGQDRLLRQQHSDPFEPLSTVAKMPNGLIPPTLNMVDGPPTPERDWYSPFKTYIDDEFVIMQTTHGDIIVLDGVEAEKAVVAIVEQEKIARLFSPESKLRNLNNMNMFALRMQEHSMPIEASVLRHFNGVQETLPYPTLIRKIKQFMTFKEFYKKRELDKVHDVLIKNPEAPTMQPFTRIFERHPHVEKSLHLLYHHLIGHSHQKGER